MGIGLWYCAETATFALQEHIFHSYKVFKNNNSEMNYNACRPISDKRLKSSFENWSDLIYSQTSISRSQSCGELDLPKVRKIPKSYDILSFVASLWVQDKLRGRNEENW